MQSGLVAISSPITLSSLRNGSYVKNIGSNISNYDKIWAEIK